MTSPFFFTISSASPVRSDSFTFNCPSNTTASAGICPPAESSTISSITSSSAGISFLLPSRITRVFGLFKIDRSSRTFFERISCTIPISVFATMIGRNVRSRKAPTPINNNAITKNIRLKYVNTFDFTISFVVFVADSAFLFQRPFSFRSATCCAVSPRIVSVCSRSAFSSTSFPV